MLSACTVCVKATGTNAREGARVLLTNRPQDTAVFGVVFIIRPALITFMNTGRIDQSILLKGDKTNSPHLSVGSCLVCQFNGLFRPGPIPDLGV